MAVAIVMTVARWRPTWSWSVGKGPEERIGDTRETLLPRRPVEQRVTVEEGEWIEQYAETSRHQEAPGVRR